MSWPRPAERRTRAGPRWRFSGPRAASTGVGKFGSWSNACWGQLRGSIPEALVQAKKGRERATRRAQAASVHVACAASSSLPFELPLCPLRGTPPALRVWSPLPSALLFWMPRSEKACLAAARKDLFQAAMLSLASRTPVFTSGVSAPGLAKEENVEPQRKRCTSFIDLVARLRFLFVRPCAARSSAQVTWTRGRGHPTVLN